MTDHPSALVSVPEPMIEAFRDWYALHFGRPIMKGKARKIVGRILSAAPAAPQAAGVGEREAIARIMDPKGWETRDRQYDAIKRSTMHDKDRPLAFANADYYIRDSLNKADACLALRAPSREPEGGAVMRQALERIGNREMRRELGAGDYGADRTRCPSCGHAWDDGKPEHHAAECALKIAQAALATREEAPAEAGEVECDGCDGDRCVYVGSLCNPSAQPQARSGEGQ